MARTYGIDIIDANDNTVAFFSELNSADMITVLTTIVPVKGHFISVSVNLSYEPADEPAYAFGKGKTDYMMPKDWGNRPFSKEPF